MAQIFIFIFLWKIKFFKQLYFRIYLLLIPILLEAMENLLFFCFAILTRKEIKESKWYPDDSQANKKCNKFGIVLLCTAKILFIFIINSIKSIYIFLYFDRYGWQCNQWNLLWKYQLHTQRQAYSQYRFSACLGEAYEESQICYFPFNVQGSNIYT